MSASEKQRKPIVIRNRTNYWDNGTSKLYITISSPESSYFREQKQQGYYTRLYWEYRYTQDHDGQTYFYTLTYNDRACPSYEGKNCFDYEDLRDLLTGGFRKILLRRYGTVFKYFVSAELGDGKGKRGFHNNPHYHCLFFLTSAHNEKYPYKKISPRDFRHLIREYWQGFDEDYGRKPYQLAKYGRIKEGEFIGLVNSPAALNYAAKYVCKDVGLIEHERKIVDILFERFIPEVRDDEGVRAEFYESCILPRLEFEDNAFGNFDFLVDYLNLSRYFEKFVEERAEELVEEELKVYRNRYCNKCRISQGVGSYALNFIDNPLDPMIPVHTNEGIIQRPLGLYLFRKFFYNVVKDPTGQPLYILNQRGIEYNVHKLPTRVSRTEERLRSYLDAVDEKLYNDALHSEVNYDVQTPYERFVELLNNNNKQKIHNYAIYKNVYEGRFWTFDASVNPGDSIIPRLDYLKDYRRFITPAFGRVDYCPSRLSDFLANDCEGYLSYDSHPGFREDIELFRCFNLLCDYLFVQGDIVREQKIDKRNAEKRFHNRLKFKDFFSDSGFFGV